MGVTAASNTCHQEAPRLPPAVLGVQELRGSDLPPPLGPSGAGSMQPSRAQGGSSISLVQWDKVLPHRPSTSSLRGMNLPMTHKGRNVNTALPTLDFFKSPNSLSVYQIHYKLLEDRKSGFLIYFLTEGTQNPFIEFL